MNLFRRRFLSTACAAVTAPIACRSARSQGSPAPADAVFPGAEWQTVTPEDLGWSGPALDDANRFFQTLPASSIVVADRGRIVVAWGDPALRIKQSSVRKSLLSALFGKPVRDGRVALDATLEQLGIDDDPPLTPAEKQATVRMLLQSRSGVYHSYVAGTPEMRATMPARGAHPPGTFWYYNNWDFNALGTIYEQQLKQPIAEAFRSEIAVPIQMQDLRPEDMYYVRSTANAEDFAKSIHPAYHFRLTARDMARFGYLYLRRGNWNGQQVIPADWVTESTTSASETSGFGPGFAYGYLWWVNGYGIDRGSFSARGALGKYIIVVPERDLVIAFANHTEFPDVLQGLSDADLHKLPNVSVAQMGKLAALLLKAQRD